MTRNSKIERRDVLRMGGGLASVGMIGAFGGFSGTARAADPTVKVINSSGDLGVIMQNMIKDLGYAKEFGVDVEYLSVANGNQIVAGIVGGSGDICTSSGFSQLFPAMEKNSSLKIVGGCLSLPTLALYSAKSDIKSVKDLPGKTVAVGTVGSLLHMMTVAVMRKYKVDESKVNFVAVGSSGDSFRAVSAGTVDCGINTADIMDEQDKYGVHALSDGQFWVELPEFTMQAAYTTKENIAAKRDQLVRTLAAHGKLYRYMQGPNSWDAWSKAYTTYFGKDADEVRSHSLWKFIQERKPLATDIALSEERFRYVQDLNVSLGIQKAILPYDQVADMSLAADAVKMLG